MVGIAAVAAFLLTLVPAAAGSGNGYNQSYSQGVTTSNLNASLIRLSTQYTIGPNVTCSFTVAGKINLTSDDYSYSVFFGASTFLNATVFALFAENSTVGQYVNYSAGGVFGVPTLEPMYFALSNGGSTLTFGIWANDALGTPTNMTVNAEAVYETGTTRQISEIGTSYQPTSGRGGVPGWEEDLVTGALVAAVVIVAVVLVVRRRRRPPATTADFQ